MAQLPCAQVSTVQRVALGAPEAGTVEVKVSGDVCFLKRSLAFQERAITEGYAPFDHYGWCEESVALRVG